MSQEQTGAAMEAPLVAQSAQGLCECLQDQQRHGFVAVRCEPESALISHRCHWQADMNRRCSQCPGGVQAPPNARGLHHSNAAQQQVSVRRPVHTSHHAA